MNEIERELLKECYDVQKEIRCPKGREDLLNNKEAEKKVKNEKSHFRCNN